MSKEIQVALTKAGQLVGGSLGKDFSFLLLVYSDAEGIFFGSETNEASLEEVTNLLRRLEGLISKKAKH